MREWAMKQVLEEARGERVGPNGIAEYRYSQMHADRD